MLHNVTGRATKCGPSAVSAIAGVPTHEAAAVMRRLFDRHAINGVYMDEIAAALAEFGWAPASALRHPEHRSRRHARRQSAYDTIFAGIPVDLRAVTLGRVLDRAPGGTWVICASHHLITYADSFVADSGAWFARKPQPWSRANPRHERVARRRIREAVRFLPVF